MFAFLLALLHWFSAYLRSRHDLGLELAALRQQLVVLQLREAFPEDTAPKYLILDRDKKFGNEVTEMLKSMEIHIKRTGFRSC